MTSLFEVCYQFFAIDIVKDFVKLGLNYVFVALQTEPDFDLDIKEEVQSECAKYGAVKHIFVDKY